MGHFKRIKLLEDAYNYNIDIGQMMYSAKEIDKKAKIISESVRYQILSEFTAFQCIEKELTDGRYEEVKGKGQMKV